MKNISLWRNKKTSDLILKKDLEKKDEKLVKSFENKMTFGTAGIRGIMGAGTSKMNEFTVAAAAQAYAEFLLSNKKTNKIVIGHDNRHNSKFFTEITAKVMEANGIKAYLFSRNELQPTPLVSYVIRKMKMDGGVVITASHNPKNYNGFKVYNKIGQQLMESDTDKISKLMDKIDPLNVEYKDWSGYYIDDKYIDHYKSDLLNLQVNKTAKASVKIVFSAQHGTAAKIMPSVLSGIEGIDVSVVKKQQDPDPDFKNTKTPNPEDGKSYQKGFSLAKRKRADAIIVTDPDADRIGLAVRHKRRYKYLNSNDSAAVYLEYLLLTLKKKKKLPKDGYIVTTHVSGELPCRIAEKYGVKVFKTHVGFKNIAEVIEETKGTFLMGFEESYGMVLDASMTRDKDAMQAAVAFTDMIKFYKSKGTDVFTELHRIWKSFSIHRTTQFSKKLTTEMTNRLLKTVAKSKKTEIDGKKIISIEDYRKSGVNFVKAVLDDGSWFAIRPSGTEPKVKVYVEIVGKKEQRLIDIVKLEKSVKNWVNDNTEEFEDKHWSWKGFFKYIIFIAITVAILSFVFMVIYKDANGNRGNPSDLISTTKKIWGNSLIRTIWLMSFLWGFASITLSAWRMKRMFQKQGENVKIKHLALSTIMGSVISFITPFAVGGDAIGYWYLRRKGYKRDTLSAAFISNTLLFEAKFIIQTIILIPIGIPIYIAIFSQNNPEAHAALIWFIIGAGWSIFATIMLFTLTLWKRFQEWLVLTTIKLLEWTRFVNITDPAGTAAGYQHEFYVMRKGMKTIWGNWLFTIEMMFYALLPLFISPYALIMIEQGWFAHDVAGVHGYMANIVLSDIVGTANSMSITPGGSGTGEWLAMQTKFLLFQGADKSSHFDVKHVTSAANLHYKIFSSWPMLLISSLTIPTIIILENARSRINMINKNKKLRNEQVIKQKPVKLYLTLCWIAFVIAFLLYTYLFLR